MDEQQSFEFLFVLLSCTIFSVLQILALHQTCIYSMAEVQRLRCQHRAEARQRKLFRRKIIRAACLILKKQRNKPRMWKKPRLGLWFEMEVMNCWENDRWMENFRMTKTSFKKLCSLVKAQMEPKQNTVREVIPLEARVAMCLYHLASSSEYRVTANQFGHSKTSVSIYLENLNAYNRAQCWNCHFRSWSRKENCPETWPAFELLIAAPNVCVNNYAI